MVFGELCGLGAYTPDKRDVLQGSGGGALNAAIFGILFAFSLLWFPSESPKLHNALDHLTGNYVGLGEVAVPTWGKTVKGHQLKHEESWKAAG